MDYTIPSDNWEQQLIDLKTLKKKYYTIPSDNWEQQLDTEGLQKDVIIPYQAITGNNNKNNVRLVLLGLYHTKR